jgi:hypothetical protein
MEVLIMDRLVVKTEGLALRCEICHQSDCLDASTQICQRCQDVIIPASAQQVWQPPLPYRRYPGVGRYVAGLMLFLLLFNMLGPIISLSLVGLTFISIGTYRLFYIQPRHRNRWLDTIINLVLINLGLVISYLAGRTLFHY